MDDKENNEDLKTLIKSYFDTVTKHIMQYFESWLDNLGASQYP